MDDLLKIQDQICSPSKKVTHPSFLTAPAQKLTVWLRCHKIE